MEDKGLVEDKNLSWELPRAQGLELVVEENGRLRSYDMIKIKAHPTVTYCHSANTVLIKMQRGCNKYEWTMTNPHKQVITPHWQENVNILQIIGSFVNRTLSIPRNWRRSLCSMGHPTKFSLSTHQIRSYSVKKEWIVRRRSEIFHILTGIQRVIQVLG